MKFQMKYGSHLPILIKIISMTGGDVLELGTGLYSTPVLHWICVPNRRHLWSYESKQSYYDLAKQYEDEFHRVILVTNWDDIDIERSWEVAFIDHEPAIRRKEDVRRLANFAKYIIIHDSDWRNEKHTHYKEIFPLFLYRHNYTFTRPHTTVLSNFVDLGKLQLC